MKRKINILAIILGIVFTAKGQETNYSVSSIPDSLKKNASVIKRYQNVSLQVFSVEKASVNYHTVYTVQNEKGNHVLVFNEYTDKYRVIDDVEIRMFDKSGKQVARYKKKDLRITASGEGLVEDGMINYLVLSATEYPVTVEYKYEIKYKGTLIYPGYGIQSEAESVQEAYFTAKVPSQLGLRHTQRGTTVNPVIVKDDKSETYTWSFKNMAVVKKEEGSIGTHPVIRLAPNKFKYDDYEGDLSSWKSFGMWYAGLYKGLGELPADRQAFFKDMVKDAKDDREKARRIYKYLQDNFRYVSIQLGIGGLRPFSAEWTDKKKYGDCKALSNYMHAALKAVGVKSYNAVINAGTNGEAMDPKFPSKFSNHVILCIPMAKDSIWLECTSKTADFGILGSFTENRNALLITENGGVLVATPKSFAAENKFSAYTTVNLESDGSGVTSTAINAKGEYKELFLHTIFESNQDDQKKFIVHQLGFRQPDNFRIARKDAAEALVTDIELSIEKLPEFTAGSKMFLSPRIYKFRTEKLPEGDNRRNDYYFDFPLEHSDTTVFKLPEGFQPEALPKAKELKCDYARYITEYKFVEADRTVYSISRLVLSDHKIPAAKYVAVKTFFDEVSKDEGQRIVIKRN